MPHFPPRQNADRLESCKAAVIAGAAGTIGVAPLLLGSADTSVQAALSLGATLGACMLFGITYRYAVRAADAANVHLKGGVVAAFGLVQAAGAGNVLQVVAGGVLTPEVIGPAALYALQSVLSFGFAATALEVAFNAGLLARFGEK